MTTFGERFSDWLIKQGKAPLSDEMIEALNDAAEATVAFLRQHQDDLIAEMQAMAADFVAGKTVDPEARVLALLTRLKEKEDDEQDSAHQLAQTG